MKIKLKVTFIKALQKPKKLLFFTLFILVLATAVVLISRVKVDLVNCQSQYINCDVELVKKLAEIKNVSVLKARKELKNVLDNDPLVKKYNYQFDLRRKYHVFVYERVAAFCISAHETNYYVDQEGLLFRSDSADNDSCLHSSQVNTEIGAILPDNDINALRLMYMLRNISGLRNVEYDGEIVTVEYKDGIKVLFSVEAEDEVLSAGRLYYIVSQFDMINEYINEKGFESVTEIDLRFKNPIIRYV